MALLCSPCGLQDGRFETKSQKRSYRSFQYFSTMNSSRECKKAISRNNAFEGNLQKDLENIEGQKKRIMRSLREKKLNFLERKSTLPKICLSSPEGKEPKIPPIRRHFSLDNAELSQLCERSNLLTKKKLSTSNAITYFETQNLLQAKPGGEKTKSSSETAKPADTITVLSHSPRLTRRARSVGLHSKTKPVLDRQLSLPLEKSAAEIPVWLDDMHEENSKGGLFKTSMQVQSPFATLGTQLPTSPLLQTQQQQYSMKFLSPLNISGQQQSVSLPCSPRTHRRRAETLPQDTELSQERRETFAEHLRTSQKLRSVSLGCAEIVEEGKEGVDDGKLSPREGRLSPQVRRLRTIQPTGADQSLPTQEDPFHLPRLMDGRGSLPFISKDGGAERGRRRVNSLITDKTTKDVSPRREAFSHGSVSIKSAEKQQISLDLGNERFSEPTSKAGFAEGAVENNKSSTHLENDDPVLWSSDDDEEEEEVDIDLDTFAVNKEKKIHSLEEIKHTRYLRMKSPHHWLPKTGPVPKSLLSSSIIVGHTKITSLDSQDRSDEENEEDDEEDDTDEFKTMEKEKDDQEMSKGTNCNSELKENVTET